LRRRHRLAGRQGECGRLFGRGLQHRAGWRRGRGSGHRQTDFHRHLVQRNSDAARTRSENLSYQTQRVRVVRGVHAPARIETASRDVFRMTAPNLIPQLPESAPFTPEQRAYLNGFFAGLFSRVPVPASAAPAPAKTLEPLTILFGSQTGNAESLAKRIAK